MNEIQAAQEVLYTALTGDTTLMGMLSSDTAVYADYALQGTSAPYITFQFIPGGQEHRHGTDGFLEMIEMIFLCKVTCSGQDQLPAITAAEQMDTVLNAVREHNSNGWVFDIVRTELFYQPLFQDSHHYRQAGGRYKVIARVPA